MRTSFLAVVAVLCGGLACSSTEHSSSTATAGTSGAGVGASGAGAVAGSGGTSAAGSAAAGQSGAGPSGGGAGGGLVLGDTPAEACIEYALAVCERRAECDHNSGANCLQSAAGYCPDLAFSPGATRTVAGLKGCAATYRALSCEEEAKGYPPCVTPGTRARGEACFFSSQCSSLECITQDSGCGVCGVGAKAGEDCTGAEVQCVYGTVCSSGKCLAQAHATVEPPRQLEGQPCDAMRFCDPSLYCQGGTCKSYPKLGMPCGDFGRCGEGVCKNGTCQPTPVAGEPCAPLFGDTLVAICAEGFLCEYGATDSEGTCVAAPKDGEHCLGPRPQGLLDEVCAKGLWCDKAAGVCQKPRAPGEKCGGASYCEDGLVCSCSGGTKCTEPVCLKQKLGGERCDEPNTVCHPAYKCDAGVCKPSELRGLFADACKQ